MGFRRNWRFYKIKDDEELVLIKQFSGEAEGVASAWMAIKVEVGTGFSNESVDI
jgi:hypothetical protein